MEEMYHALGQKVYTKSSKELGKKVCKKVDRNGQESMQKK